MKAKSKVRPLDAFRRLVDERGERLRQLSFDQLLDAGDQPGEVVEVQGRRGTICHIVEEKDDGSLRVVVQGFLSFRILPFGSHVALDGFYKRPRGDIEAMPDKVFYEFD